jgi:hypothetical protein
VRAAPTRVQAFDILLHFSAFLVQQRLVEIDQFEEALRRDIIVASLSLQILATLFAGGEVFDGHVL